MNTACAICKGACCEFFQEHISPNPYIADWQTARGSYIPHLRSVRFDCVCPHLVLGKCGIYPNRPQVCKDFLVGSRACRDAILFKRSPEQQTEIRKAMDEQSMLSGKYRTGGGTITKR